MLGLEKTQCLGRTLWLSRNFHSGQLKFQFVKDVYIKLNYRAPFPEDDKRLMLERINMLPLEGSDGLQSFISKKLSKEIVTHREKYGKFECLEQLLDLPRINIKSMEKACTLLLGVKDEESKEKTKQIAYTKKIKAMFSKDIIPRLDMKLYKELSNPSTVSISLTLQRIAYVQVDKSGHLSDWGILPAIDMESVSSALSYQHHSLHKVVTSILSELPPADYYLLEEMLPILQQDAYIKTKICQTKFFYTLFALLPERKQNSLGESSVVHTIKPSVMDFMLNLKIGNERLSFQEQFLPTIQSGDSGGQFKTKISDEQWKYYYQCDSHARELLLGALARSLAFNFISSFVE